MHKASVVNFYIDGIIYKEAKEMYNWSVDLKKMGKNSKAAVIWRLEQIINFGLNGEKIDKTLAKKYWKELHIDPARKRFLKLLLWPKRS